MSITLKEIAELAGCSRGTVDRALKNSDRIKAETKEKILKIVQDYGYKPNFVGQALANSNKNYEIAIVINSKGNEFFDDVIKGMKNAESEFSPFNIKLTFFELERFSVKKQLDTLENIDWQHFDALIISAVDDEKVSKKLSQISKSSVAVITVNSDTEFNGKLCYVGCDYEKSGRTAGGIIKMVCDNGKNGLCLINGSENVSGHSQRAKGILEVVKTAPNIEDCGIVYTDDNEIDSYEKVKSLLKENKNITVICAASGGVVGTQKAVSELQRNIKIIAFDNTPKINDLLSQQKILATVNQKPFEQGYFAVKIAYEWLVCKIKPKQVINTDLTIIIKENL